MRNVITAMFFISGENIFFFLRISNYDSYTNIVLRDIVLDADNIMIRIHCQHKLQKKKRKHTMLMFDCSAFVSVKYAIPS